MQEQETFNMIGLIRIILKRKYTVFTVCLLTAIGCLVITSERIMPPFFKSTESFYPNNPLSSDQQSIFGEKEIKTLFGGDQDVDRMLSIGSSTQLMYSIIKKFNLYQHYEIDSVKYDDHRIRVLEEFLDNFEILKTKLGSVSVEIYDIDRFLAAEMAHFVVTRIDEIYNEMLMENKRKILTIYKKRYEQQLFLMHQIKDSLKIVRKLYGTYNIDMQSEGLSKDVALTEAELKLMRAKLKSLERFYSPADSALIELNAVIKGYEEKFLSLTSPSGGGMINLESFAKGVDQTVYLQERLKKGTEELSDVQALYERYKEAMDQNISTISIIEYAYPAEKKSGPIRWLIMLSSVFLVFFMLLLILVILERYKYWLKEFESNSLT